MRRETLREQLRREAREYLADLRELRDDLKSAEGWIALALTVAAVVIAAMGPMQGAREFLDALRRDYQVVILSDTFYEFAMPLMAQLGMPTLFCHKLEADRDGFLVNYHLRMPNQKQEAVRRFKEINFKVIAAGDSYNDTAMLGEAHAGILFHPPQNVIDAFPQFPVTMNYAELRAAIDRAAQGI